jgi:hypothetical protein
MRMRLKPLYDFELRPREPFNFYLTASCYNFNWWFDGSKCVIPLSSSPPLVAVARQESSELMVTVYGVKGGREDVAKMVEHALGVTKTWRSSTGSQGGTPYCMKSLEPCRA